IIAGSVYRGQRFPDLAGLFVFADYVAGNIWKVYYDGQSASGWQLLANSPGVDAFGTDPRNGDILLCNYSENKIKPLVYQTDPGNVLPPTLSGTGAFADTANLIPAAGVVPYELNVPFWSDGAIKSRWFSVPTPGDKIGFNANGNWNFPAGAVWIK